MKGLKAYRLDVPPMLADRGIDRMLAFAVPLTVRFRGIEVREGTLLHGPEGWGSGRRFGTTTRLSQRRGCARESRVLPGAYPWRDEIGCR